MANDDMMFAVLLYGKSKAVANAIAESLRQFEANQAIELKEDGVLARPMAVSDDTKKTIRRIRSRNVSEKVLDYITENKFAVSSDLKHIAQGGAIHTALSQLIDKGLIVRQGERGSYRYELANTDQES